MCGFLLYRLAPDVRSKPYYEDEAVSGLIAMRPLGEVLDTVVLDRGGAPLHFVLAHAVFWVDPSADALRWLSVAAALAAVPLCFDLGRRLGGAWRRVVAAAVAASSTALAVYGSFGRMYALFVFVAALFSDLFVRALQLRTTRRSGRGGCSGMAAPRGASVRGDSCRRRAACRRRDLVQTSAFRGLAGGGRDDCRRVPFLVADLRLADRAAIGARRAIACLTGRSVAAARHGALLVRGRDGLPSCSSRRWLSWDWSSWFAESPPFAALTLSILVPPILFLLIRTESTPDLSPRHLFYGLPLWAAAIGVGMTKFLRRNSPWPSSC